MAGEPGPLRWSQCRGGSGVASASPAGAPDEAAVWLLGWGSAFAGQVLSARTAQQAAPAAAGHPAMPVGQVLEAAVLLEAYDQAVARACTLTAGGQGHVGPVPPPPLPAASLYNTWDDEEDEDNLAVGGELVAAASGTTSSSSGGASPSSPPPLCAALEAALLASPAREAADAMVQLLGSARDLPAPTLRAAVRACVQRCVFCHFGSLASSPSLRAGHDGKHSCAAVVASPCRCLCRLQRDGDVAQSQPVPLLLAAAAAWPQLCAAGLEADVHAQLPALLAASLPLLPSCQTEQLVQVLSALAVTHTPPPADWQAMYFASLRSRLPLLQVRSAAAATRVDLLAT